MNASDRSNRPTSSSGNKLTASEDTLGMQASLSPPQTSQKSLFLLGLAAIVALTLAGLVGQVYGLKSVGNLTKLQARLESAETEYARLGTELGTRRNAIGELRAQQSQAESELKSAENGSLGPERQSDCRLIPPRLRRSAWQKRRYRNLSRRPIIKRQRTALRTSRIEEAS
jgi:hypothetical protein